MVAIMRFSVIGPPPSGSLTVGPEGGRINEVSLYNGTFFAIAIYIYVSLQLGDVFTIHVAGKHMTFVFGQSSLQYVFSSSHLSFKETVLPFVMKTG